MARDSETINQKLERLLAAQESLRRAMPVIGEAQYPDGLPALAQRAGAATVLDDDGTEMEIQAAGEIRPGDLVALSSELRKQGDPLSVAAEGGKLLAAVSMEYAQAQSGEVFPIVLVYTQGGKTWLQVVKYESGAWVLGAVGTVREDVALESVCAVPDGRYRLTLLYADAGGDAMVQFWFVDYQAMTVKRTGSDVLAVGATPKHICAAAVNYDRSARDHVIAAYLNAEGKICVVGFQRGSRQDSETSEDIAYANIKRSQVLTPGAVEGLACTEGRMEDFVIAAPDAGESRSGAWAMGPQGGANGAVWLSYPGADGKRYLLTLWVYRKMENAAAVIDYFAEPVGCRAMSLNDYQPGAVLLRANGSSYGSVWSVEGTDSGAGLEIWSGGFELQSWPMWFGEISTRHGKAPQLVSACLLGENRDSMAVGFADEGKYRAAVCRVIEWNGRQIPIAGTAVELEAVGEWAGLVHSGDAAALICQKDGSILLQQLQAFPVAEATRDGIAAQAVAITGGRGGERVKLRGRD